jgi:membrane-anchored protein YejM (alkaline phosphatase superfamily)
MIDQKDYPRTDLEARARGHAALTLWLVNVLLGVLVGTAYLRHLPDSLSPRGWTFVVFGLVSSVATLALIPAAVSWLSLRFARDARTQAWIQALAGAAFLSLMKVDTVVYSLLRYHFFSSAVFNVAVTPGSEDAVHLGGHVWLPVAIVVLLLTVGEYFFWRHLYRRRLEAGSPARLESVLWRPVVVWGIVLLAVIGVEKSIYAAADLEGDREVRNAADILPAYSHLRVSQLFPEQLGGEPARVREVEIQPKGAPLAYPHEWPVLDPLGPRPNVLFLVVDSWRRDCLDPEVTPALFALSREGRRFENHRSGGNGTRFGIFSMLYGLHGSYWFSALQERRPPVLLDVLGEAGYDLQVYSSASMNFPEFRNCAWVECLESVHDDFPFERAAERDQAVARSFRAYLEGRRARRASGAEPQPFFAFLLLDSAHQPYDYPGRGPFQPATEGLDYIELAHKNTPELVQGIFNRYRNALHFTDGVAADVIQDLRDCGELEDTLVVVTGDHGDEFQESGFWGHTSNFTPEQVDVPLFLLGGVVEPGVELRPTSHVDLAPTVLELLGADPGQRGLWCLGENLMQPPASRDIVVSGWEHVGVITPEVIFRVRMGGRNATDVSVFDQRWQPQNDANDWIEAHQSSLVELSEECNRFLLGNDAQ